MKPINLFKMDVYVKTEYERAVAIHFFKRACRRPVTIPIKTNSYVGICGRKHSEYYGRVFCGYTDCKNRMIHFKDISTLADTPSRLNALESAIAHGETLRTSSVIEDKPKTPSTLLLPTVDFVYPLKNGGWKRRKVRAVKIDGVDIIGYEINSENNTETFKRFKRSRIFGEYVGVLQFNS